MDYSKNSEKFNYVAVRRGEREPAHTCASSGEPLPCLYRNNSIESSKKNSQTAKHGKLLEAISIQKKYRKSASALSFNVQGFAFKFGLERLGFLTLTFKDHVVDYKEASRRFNSLATNVLNERYQGWIKVMERQKSGRIHFHCLVALSNDIREGFDFKEAERGVYASASPHLRQEWAFWRSTAQKYRFGRTELLPIRSSHEAIGRYVGKYIGKHMIHRCPEDAGARLVSYSKNIRIMNTKFSWVSEGAAAWRAKVKTFVYLISEKTGCEPSFDGIRSQLGPKWAYNHREFIATLPIDA